MEQFKVRKPAVAGHFYPSASDELSKQIAGFIDKNATQLDVRACMLPHAGYLYSGQVAAQTISRVKIKEHIILLGPNHTGYGADFSIMTDGAWETPLGEIKIDTDLAKQMLKGPSQFREDEIAHRFEHSLEVELPLLQFFRSDFKMVPVTIASSDAKALKEAGIKIASAIKQSRIQDTTLIIASSDMTHYEPEELARKKDTEAIEAILELNEVKLVEKVSRLNISMCGWAPVLVMITAAKSLGAKGAKLIKYQTSGDTTGDTSSVVGYAGIIIS